MRMNELGGFPVKLYKNRHCRLPLLAREDAEFGMVVAVSPPAGVAGGPEPQPWEPAE